MVFNKSVVSMLFGIIKALEHRLVVFSHPYFVLFNLQGDELMKFQAFPSQRQTEIPSEVFKTFPVSMHTFMFESILGNLKIVIPSFAISAKSRLHKGLFEFQLVFSDLFLRKSFSDG